MHASAMGAFLGISSLHCWRNIAITLNDCQSNGEVEGWRDGLGAALWRVLGSNTLVEVA